MVHIVIDKKIRLLIIGLLIGLSCFSQEKQTDPYFAYKNEKNKHLSKLHYFLGTFKPVKLDDCLFASGTFKFKIAKDGKITDFQVTGNLPDSLVSTIKKRIYETEKHWVFANKIISSSKWFVLPVFIDRKIGLNCHDNRLVEENYEWVHKLFDNTNSIIDTPTSYLIAPFYLFGMN